MFKCLTLLYLLYLYNAFFSLYFSATKRDTCLENALMLPAAVVAVVEAALALR